MHVLRIWVKKKIWPKVNCKKKKKKRLNIRAKENQREK